MGAAIPSMKCVVSHWSADQAATIGVALAFYCAFSIAPLLALFGKSTADILLHAMRSSQSTNGHVATIVSAVTLLVGQGLYSTRSKQHSNKSGARRELVPKGVRHAA